MPLITNTSYLEFPYRALSSFWKKSYRRTYFAMNKAKQCIDFESGDVSLPSPEEMKKAIAGTLLHRLGQDKDAIPVWLIYVILLGVLAIAAKVFGVI